MNRLQKVVTSAKARTPTALRPAARFIYRTSWSALVRLLPLLKYEARKHRETEFFEVHNTALPDIFHYWSNKFLVPQLSPLGFTNSSECFRERLSKICKAYPRESCTFLSIGSGSCETEINITQWLHACNVRNFVFECTDVTGSSIEKAKELARQHGVQDHFIFRTLDINHWSPMRKYHSVLAIQSLHHIVKLESVLDNIRSCLIDDGYFLADDMIGRNGHQRWPESLEIVQSLWRELPDRYKYNHQLRRFEKEFDNWDCSTQAFEGIRSQDILPLLIERFHFETFAAFGNVIDIFIDRSFGPNFDSQAPADRTFIDRVHVIDVDALEKGMIKPTHMIAVMQKIPTETRIHKHFSPKFCVRPLNVI